MTNISWTLYFLLLATLFLLPLASISALSVPSSSSSSSALIKDPETYKAHLRAKIAHSVAKGERRANERDKQRRSVCDNCHRPPALCVCDVLPQQRFDTDTRVLILQHPNERRKKNFSTVPLIKLILKNVQVIHGYRFEELDRIPPIKKCLDNGQRPLLLYPSPEAISLDKTNKEKSTMNARSSSNKMDDDTLRSTDSHLLIIVDGTWTEAKRMVRDSPALVEACQLVQFTSESSSLYDAVRQEPEEHCLSTLEACAQALQLLEPTTNTQRAIKYLHGALKSHVDSHLVNAAMMAPRSAGAASAKLYAKNRRRREIELKLFRAEHGKQEQQSSKTGDKSIWQESPETRKTRTVLPDGAILRSLEPTDAPLVDSWWEYKSAKSLPLVMRRIALDRGVACLGIEIPEDGSLVACIMRYDGGILGMLHVEEAYRRRGYGSALLRQATKALQERNEERVAFIVDGNHASEAVFASVGWERDNPKQKRGTGKRRAKRKWIHRG